MDNPPPGSALASLSLLSVALTFSNNCFGSQFNFTSQSSAGERIVASNYVLVSNPSRSALEHSQNRNASEPSERVLLDPILLGDFAKDNRLSLIPKYMVETALGDTVRQVVVGLRGTEVWKYEVKKAGRKLMRIGLVKTPTDAEKIRFESSILDSKLILLVQPTKDLDSGLAVVDANAATYAVLETTSALFSVQLNAQNDAIITQIGLRNSR